MKSILLYEAVKMIEKLPKDRYRVIDIQYSL